MADLTATPINPPSHATRAPILLVGLNHKTAPVEIREKFAFSADAATVFAEQLKTRIDLLEVTVLSTCNRTEIYMVGRESDPGEILFRLAEHQGVPPAVLSAHSYTHRDRDAAEHLCRVASGLDSMVVGEGQVLGQVKAAIEASNHAHTSGPILAALFRQAVTAGKRARSETEIQRGAVSVSHAAVELARQIFADLSGCQALVIGAGEMSELTLQALKRAGMKRAVTIASRSRERVESLAHRCDATGIDWEEMPGALATADIVIVSTSAPHFILRPEVLRQAMRTRRGRQMFIIDISVPRNVDPRSAELPDVFLYNIDDLDGVVQRNLGDRSREIVRVEEIVQEELARFQQWFDGLAVVPAIVGMRSYAEAIRQQEWERFENRVAHLPERDRQLMESLTRQLVNRLLHQPTIQLKSLGVNGKGYDRVEVVRELFTLPEEVEVTVKGGDAAARADDPTGLDDQPAKDEV